MKKFESVFSHHIFLHIDLNALPRALQMRKSRFSHQPERNEAPRYPDFALVRLQIGRGGGAELLYKRARSFCPTEFARIRIVAQRPYLFDLFLARSEEHTSELQSPD